MMALGLTILSTPAFSQQAKPNILFILADNTGYGDIGAYGGGELRGAPTPHIDQLAAEGLRLTQFLVEPSCTPSSASADSFERYPPGQDLTCRRNCFGR